MTANDVGEIALGILATIGVAVLLPIGFFVLIGWLWWRLATGRLQIGRKREP